MINVFLRSYTCSLSLCVGNVHFLDSSQRGDLSQRGRIRRTRENGCLRQESQVHLLVPRVYRLLGHQSRVR
jgi:hypothetical protein